MKTNEIIRALREDHDLNQTEMGKILYKSQRAISRMESGEIHIQEEDIKIYCKYFNVSADYILGLPRNLPYPER